MKELSIEEKAKAYDGNYKGYTELVNRLENVKDAIKKQNYGIAMDILCKPYPEFQITAFPELKESENWISKEIIKYLKEKGDFRSCWIAWLEKQGNLVKYYEDKLDRCACENFNKGYKKALEKQGRLIKALQISNAKIGELIEKNYYLKEQLEKQGNNMGISEVTKQELEDNLNKALEKETPESCNEFLDEQGEKKPIKEHNACEFCEDRYGCVSPCSMKLIEEEKIAGKIEPKFKVGDWIIFNEHHNSVYQVEKIQGLRYYLRHYTGGSLSVHIDNELIRPWTIQDAKDGDVVVDKSDGAIGIFQSIGHHPDGGSYNDPSYCFLHCRYDDGYFYADFENGNTMDSYDVIPATKEQRDQLEKAMADAGYTFDFEKKELKKIEQKPVIKMKTPEESLGIDSETYSKIVDECIYGEQKPAWSEEDKKMSRFIGNAITADGASIYLESKGIQVIDAHVWLDGLKERVLPQPKQEWKPSDEQMERINTAINVLGKGTLNGKQLIELQEQLKKRRDETTVNVTE